MLLAVLELGVCWSACIVTSQQGGVLLERLTGPCMTADHSIQSSSRGPGGSVGPMWGRHTK